MSNRLGAPGRRSRSLWLIALGTFAIHAAIVTGAVKARDSVPYWPTGRVLELVLLGGDFWVYRWVMPLFNAPWFGNPSFRITQFFGLSTLKGASQFLELCFDVLCGVVYAAVVVSVIGLKRNRMRLRAGSSAAG